MGTVEICDNSVWFKHIDDTRIVSMLSELKPEEVIPLVIDGQLGFWARMQQGDNPEPTLGLKPAGGRTGDWWKAQQGRHGTRVAVRLAKSADIETSETSV